MQTCLPVDATVSGNLSCMNKSRSNARYCTNTYPLSPYQGMSSVRTSPKASPSTIRHRKLQATCHTDMIFVTTTSGSDCHDLYCFYSYAYSSY